MKAGEELLEREIPIARIHPDPFQPRIYPDSELSESIKLHGILQAIRVEEITSVDEERVCVHCDRTFADLAAESGHFMIQDGERRYRGSVAAGRSTVLAKVVPPLTAGERLVKQLTANTGKPLNPIEEAFAFRRIMESEGWSQNELARQLGRPRSLVGDRVRLVELHPSWLEAISSGKLQTSHAAIISVFSPVPAEYQEKAVANLLADFRAKQFLEDGDAIPVDGFKHLIYVAFRDYIKPLNEVRSYKGPTFSFKRHAYGSPEKFAADIELWRPIAREAEKRRRKQLQQNAPTRTAVKDGTKKHREALDALEAVGAGKRATDEYYIKPKKGEEIVYKVGNGGVDTGWAVGYDPKVLLESVLPTKLVRVYGKNDAGLAVTDTEALQRAKTSYFEKLNALLRKETRKLAAKLDRLLAPGTFAVSGAGTREVLRALMQTVDRWDSNIEFPALAIALGIEPDYSADDEELEDSKLVNVDKLSETDCGRILGAYAALITTRKTRHDRIAGMPDMQALERELTASMQGIPLALPKQPPAAVRRADSKAAGKERAKEIAIAREANANDVAPQPDAASAIETHLENGTLLEAVEAAVG